VEDAYGPLFRHLGSPGGYGFPYSLTGPGAKLDSFLTMGPATGSAKEGSNRLLHRPEGGLFDTALRGANHRIPLGGGPPGGGRVDRQNRSPASPLLGPRRRGHAPCGSPLPVTQLTEGSPAYPLLVYPRPAAPVGVVQRRGGGFTHARGGEAPPAFGLQRLGADGVAPVAPRRVRLLLSGPLLRGSGPDRSLNVLPQPQLRLSLNKRRGTPPPYRVRYQA